MNKTGQYCEIGDNVSIGKNTTIRSYTIICDDVVIGNDCTIGPYVLIQPGVVIEDNCRVHSHSFLCEGVTLEDEVFFSHHAVTCNEKHPRAVRDVPWKLKDEDRILIKRGANIGSNATILSGVTVGEGAEVGAGATVVDDVPDGGVVISPKAVLIDLRYGDWGRFL